jgi:two-component system CheB/CheR fusion protein
MAKMKGVAETKLSDPKIVGIGASAGGMEALHDLFDYLPANTGFSYVVVQHLSPDYKSLMADLLSKHTAMKVREAVDNCEIEPDCIYVIPSKKLMTVQDQRLRLVEKLKSTGPNNAVDIFFSSLAEDVGDRAVGVVLSGTGTDGSKGIEAIKRRGGIVIVQDPLTAAFDGMPNSAIATGYADLIVPPEMIGEELLEFIRDEPLVQSFHSMNRQDEKSLRELLELLHKNTKHDFNQYKRPTLLRRLAKRMSEVGSVDLESYRQYIRENDDELKILGREFLINVTKFFRDVDAFECLRTQAIPNILSKKSAEDTIKVWVAACSSGEEAYTVAMLFRECMEKTGVLPSNLKIFATDIDTDALETASRGVYNEGIARDVPPALLKKYFIEEGKSYRVAPELRKHVVFANHDLLKDHPFSHIDLILCRNMFIYINPALQRRALKKFHFALKLDGYLMLGPSENIGPLKEAMLELSRKWKLYQCTTKVAVSDGETMLVPLERSAFPQLPTHARNPLSNMAEILKDTLLEDRKIVALVIDREFKVKQAVGSYKNFLHFPEDIFNFNLLKLVAPDLAVALGVTVRRAIALNEKSILKRVAVHHEASPRFVNIIVKPYLTQKEFQEPFLSVILEEDNVEPRAVKAINPAQAGDLDRITELERELIDTRENLQAVIEELETANEEMQANNEEMISTNEELQSTNEELQSLNEELHTVSAEHQSKIQELYELNDDLNNYFNNSDIGQILVDRKMVIRKFSPSSRRMINFIDADIGRSLADITTNISSVDMIDQIRKVIDTGELVAKEIETTDHHFYLMRLSPYVRRDKTIDGVVINFIDISQIKRLDGIIQGIFKSSTSGIAAKRAVRDRQRKIVDFEYLAVNEAAEKMFKVKPGARAGEKLLRMFNGDKTYFDMYVNVVETGVPVRLEFYQEATDKWYDTTVVKMLDGVVTTYTDITKRKKDADIIARNYEDLEITSQKLSESNMQLERSNFDLLQFASVASHDLKEPLRKIQAFGNLLQSKINGKLSETETGYFDKMINASNRMQYLIDDVLTLSKLSNNGIVKESTDLKALVKEICSDLEVSIRDKKAVIRIGNLPHIDAVPGQMRQVFQNLISNALKFAGPNPPVISIEQKTVSQDYVEMLGISPETFTCVEVSDNGIGFENEYSEKIFGIFQRLHGRNFEGTGIGLAIARKIVENHGGYIFARGEVNKGATFQVILPLTPQSNIGVR